MARNYNINIVKTLAPGQRVATVLVLTVNASVNTDNRVDNVGQRTDCRVEPPGGFASQRVRITGHCVGIAIPTRLAAMDINYPRKIACSYIYVIFLNKLRLRETILHD